MKLTSGHVGSMGGILSHEKGEKMPYAPIHLFRFGNGRI